jgi:hypothetical protein
MMGYQGIYILTLSISYILRVVALKDKILVVDIEGDPTWLIVEARIPVINLEIVIVDQTF